MSETFSQIILLSGNLNSSLKSLIQLFTLYNYLQAEISLCRVYKRAGVDDHASLPHYLPMSRASNHKNKHNNVNQLMAHHNSNSNIRFLKHHGQYETDQVNHQNEEENHMQLTKQAQEADAAATTTSNNSSSLLPSNENAIMVDHDDGHLNRLVSYNHQQFHQFYNNIYAPTPPSSQGHHQQYYQPQHTMHFSNMVLQPQLQSSSLALNNSLPITSFSDRLWEWNPIPEPTSRDFTTMSFK